MGIIISEKIHVKQMKCLHDDKIFNDITNKTGALSKHLKKINVSFDKQNLFDHFKLVSQIQINKKLCCPLCDYKTIDIHNKSGIFTRHIKNEHKLTVEEFCDQFDDYIHLWKTNALQTKRNRFINDSEENRIQCKICGEYFKKITNKHLKNHNITPTEYKEKYNVVSTCSKTTTLKQRDISYELQYQDVIDRIKSYNISPLFDKNQYCGVNIKHKYKFKCNNCNNVFSDHLDNGREIICRICNPKLALHPNKKFEIEVYQFIKSLNITDIITNDRKTIYPKEIDLFIPSKNIAIECNGTYWHSELYKDKNYHIEKTLLLKNKNIRTIHIFEDEWYNKQNILKSKISHILKKCNRPKIFARKCKIQKISTTECSDFLNKNHIQGSDSSNVKLGAFYNNQLIAVMTFSNPRLCLGYKSNNQFVELSRFCSDINLHVIGIAGKLLNHYIKYYDPTKIITYADLRFTNFKNNLYEKLNFKKISQTKPNYFWCKNKNRYNRFKFTKQKLINQGHDPNLTETQIMHQQKFYRIWDCGHLKYELIID